MAGNISRHQKIIAASQNIKEKEFWLKQFPSTFVKTGFPNGVCRTGKYPGDSKVEEFWIKGPAAEKLREISGASDHKLHIVLMAGLILLLRKYTGNQDIIIGTPVYQSGGKAKFINTVLPIKARVKEDMTFQQLLKQVGAAFTEAVKHQNYPMEILAEQLAPGNDGDDFPLFDVSLLLENIHDKNYIRHIHHNMAFSFSSYTTGILGLVEYNLSRWDRTAVERIIESFECLLRKACIHPDKPVGQLDAFILPPVEIHGQGGNAGDGHPKQTVRVSTVPADIVEEKLARTWSEILQLERTAISPDTGFLDLSGDSTKAIMLTSRIHRDFEVSVPLKVIFRSPTLKELAAYIRTAVKRKYHALEPAEEKEYYPLSSPQKRLYILQHMDLNSCSYNIYLQLNLKGTINRQRLEYIFTTLMERHESLRTSFEIVDDEPVQRIHPTVDFEIEYYQAQGQGWPEGPCGSIEETVKNFIRPFDLSKAPLMRVGAIDTRPDHHLLLVDIHHIIMDATSRKTVAGEFTKLYQGKEPGELRLRYRDFSQWQNRLFSSAEIEWQRQFWLNEFKNGIPGLNLPLDFPRSETQESGGGFITFPVAVEETKALEKIARQQDATIVMVLLALLNIMLAKICGQEDIVIGIPAAGRRHIDLERIVGLFINTLAMRNFPAGEKRFKDFLQEVKERTLAAFENQDYPLEDLVEQLGVNRDASRNPLFDVAFTFWDEDQTRLPPGEARITDTVTPSYGYENKTSKFDLSFGAIFKGEQLVFTCEYRSNLFEKASISLIADSLLALVRCVIHNPDTRISQLDCRTSTEKELRKIEDVEFNF